MQDALKGLTDWFSKTFNLKPSSSPKKKDVQQQQPTQKPSQPDPSSPPLVKNDLTEEAVSNYQKTHPNYKPVWAPDKNPQPPMNISKSTSYTIPRNPNFKNFNVSSNVKNAIETAAKQYGVPASLLYDIALQESSFDPKHVNDSPDGVNAGYPTGLFQFNKSTWNTVLNTYNNKPNMSLHLSSTDQTDPLANAQAAAYLIKHGQLDKWAASEGVWGQFWSPQELENMGFYSQSPTHVKGKRYSEIANQ